MHKLSKSTFSYGVQCLKRLYLHKHHKKLGIDKDPMTALQEAKFSAGSSIGLLAQQRFPGGVDCTPSSPYSYTESLFQTKLQVHMQKPCVIYEAAFQSPDGVLCAVDILTCSDSNSGSDNVSSDAHHSDKVTVSGAALRWDAYEVKSTKSVKDEHIVDAALQYWVMAKCGMMLNSINILHLNEEYKLEHGAGARVNINELFKVSDITEDVLRMQSFISEEVEKQLLCVDLKADSNNTGHSASNVGNRSKEVVVDIEDMLAHSCLKTTATSTSCVSGTNDARMPISLDNIPIGKQCTSPYPCNFRGYCFGRVFGPGDTASGGYDSHKSILNLSYGDKKWKFLREFGIKKTTEIPLELLGELSANQQVQVRADLSGEEVVDVPQLRRFLRSLQYPLYYLDFETIMPAIPLFPGTGCYETLCVQYSLHIQHKQFGDSFSCSTLDETVAVDDFVTDSSDTAQSQSRPIIHAEYLADHASREDPTVAFMERLVRDLDVNVNNMTDVDGDTADGDSVDNQQQSGEKQGSILVYSSYEASRLKEIARRFPQYEAAVNSICARIVDMASPFQKKHWYLPELDGKYSIKRVYPVVVPKDKGAYSRLQISEGQTASTAFLDLVTTHIGECRAAAEDVMRVRKDLLEYCRLDTWAMVRIMEALVGKVRSYGDYETLIPEANAKLSQPRKSLNEASAIKIVKTKKFAVLDLDKDWRQ